MFRCDWVERKHEDSTHMAAGLMALSTRQFAPTINRAPLSAAHQLLHLSFLSEGSGSRMPPAERNALYGICIRYILVHQLDYTGNWKHIKKKYRVFFVSICSFFWCECLYCYCIAIIVLTGEVHAQHCRVTKQNPSHYLYHIGTLCCEQLPRWRDTTTDNMLT